MGQGRGDFTDADYSCSVQYLLLSALFQFGPAFFFLDIANAADDTGRPSLEGPFHDLSSQRNPAEIAIFPAYAQLVFEQRRRAFQQFGKGLLKRQAVARQDALRPCIQVVPSGAGWQSQCIAEIVGNGQFVALDIPVPQAVALPFQGETPTFLAGLEAIKQGSLLGDVAHGDERLRPSGILLTGEKDIEKKKLAVTTSVPLCRQKTLPRQVVAGRLLVVGQKGGYVLTLHVGGFAPVTFKGRGVRLDDDAAVVQQVKRVGGRPEKRLIALVFIPVLPFAPKLLGDVANSHKGIFISIDARPSKVQFDWKMSAVSPQMVAQRDVH